MAKLVRGNFNPELIQAALRQGDHNVVQMARGSFVAGDVLVFDAAGNAIDGGTPSANLLAARKYSTSWTAQTSVTVTHNLATTAVLVQVFDASGNLVIPENVAVTNANVVTLTFGAGFTGSVVVIAISTAAAPAQEYSTSWTAQTSVTVTHNLATTAVLVQVFDASGNLVIPQAITLTSANVVTLTFGAGFTGSVVVIGLATAVRSYSTSWTAQTSVTVTHNLATTAVLVQVFDASGNLVIPQAITLTNANVVTLTFGASFTGSANILG